MFNMFSGFDIQSRTSTFSGKVSMVKPLTFQMHYTALVTFWFLRF